MHMMNRSSLLYVVNHYPWKQSETMRSLIPHAMIQGTPQSGRETKVTVTGMLDMILPDVRTLLSPAQVKQVEEDVEHQLGRKLRSSLDLYESVHDCVVLSGRQTYHIRLLFDKLFEKEYLPTK